MIEKVKEYRAKMADSVLAKGATTAPYVLGYRQGFFDALDEIIELLETEEALEVQKAVDWAYENCQK